MTCETDDSNINSLATDITQMLPWVNDPANLIRRASKEFFQESTIWRYCDEKLTVNHEDTMYSLSSTTGGKVAKIIEVFSNHYHHHALQHYNEYGEIRIPEVRHVHQIYGHHHDDCREQFWYSPRPSTIKFNQNWHDNHELRLNIALMPGDDGYVDPELLCDWRETIINYAMYLGHSIPDKDTGRIRSPMVRRDVYAIYKEGLEDAQRYHTQNMKAYRPPYQRNDHNNAARGAGWRRGRR